MPTNTARKIDPAPQSEIRLRTIAPTTSMGIYLDSIGKIPLLTRDAEVTAGKRIEAGQHALLAAIASDPAGVAEIARIGRRLDRQRISVRKLVSATRDGSFDEATEEIRILDLMSSMAKRPVESLREMRLTEAVIAKVVSRIRSKASADTVATIAKAQREIDAGRAALVRANLKLVVHLAKKRAQRGGGLALHDLIQDGNIGLIRAARTFDYTRELRFNTYATFWIKQMMDRAVEITGRTIRLPTHLIANQKLVRRAVSVARNRTGEDPTQEQIAEMTSRSVEQVRRAQEAVADAKSLDVPMGDEDGAPLIDFVAKDAGERGDETVTRSVRDELLRSVVASVTPRERLVLEYRFGIGRRKEMTLAEIGDLLGVSRERVRQVEVSALARCRASCAAETLRQLAEGI